MTDDIYNHVDQLLADLRPDRYEPDGGDEWLDEVAALIANDIPQAEARARAARQIVRQREGVKTQAANRILRDVYRSGQLVLGWLDALDLPIAVAKERVALRAVTPSDLDRFAVDERRDAAREFATRNETCEAGEWIAERMRADGVEFLRDFLAS